MVWRNKQKGPTKKWQGVRVRGIRWAVRYTIVVESLLFVSEYEDLGWPLVVSKWFWSWCVLSWPCRDPSAFYHSTANLSILASLLLFTLLRLQTHSGKRTGLEIRAQFPSLLRLPQHPLLHQTYTFINILNTLNWAESNSKLL